MAVARTTKTVFLGACVLTALVVTLVLSTGGNNRSPAPTGFGQVDNQADCGSQVGLRAAQRRYRLCLYSQPLSSLTGQSRVGEQAPRGGRLHWSAVFHEASVIGSSGEAALGERLESAA